MDAIEGHILVEGQDNSCATKDDSLKACDRTKLVYNGCHGQLQPERFRNPQGVRETTFRWDLRAFPCRR
jgi:hypothetical protein